MSQDVRQQMIALLPRLRRFAYGLTGNQDDADDVVQATCERALSRLHQWQPDTRLDSWMFRITQTIWIDRKRAQNVRGASIDPQLVNEMADSKDQDRDTEAQHTLNLVCQALERLPEEHRSVLVLISVDGMSYKDAAETLQIPIGTVMSRLARARKRLHELVYDTNMAKSIA